MANFIETINNKIKPYFTTITIVLISILFIGIGIYYYFGIYLKKFEKNKKYKDIANENNRKEEINVYYISVPWCPYCKKADPEWKIFSNQYNGKNINDVNINCMNFIEGDPGFEKIIEDYKIGHYPTVFIIYDSKRIDFESAVTYYSLDQFVQKVANDIK